MKPYNQRINQFREKMRQTRVNACIIPMSDPHLSEYIPSFWKGIEWLCGFNGSAGTLLITQQEATLWTDGRYWLQAQKQLQDTEVILQKIGKGHTYISYLISHLRPQQTVGIDGRIFSFQIKKELEEELLKHQILLNSQCDLLSPLWKNRPNLKREAIYEHPLEFAIQTPNQKLLLIQKEMKKRGANTHIISSLEDIAWISNLRGRDIECNPVFMGYLLIDLQGARLFIQPNTLSKELSNFLKNQGFHIGEYEKIQQYLKKLRNRKILIDTQSVSASLVECLSRDNILIQDCNPSLFLKSIKNKEQIKHIRKAMEQDGVALCHLEFWLKNSLKKGMKISELDIESKLHSLRASHPLFITDSFNAIVGFNANGAQCHYRATKQNFSYIQGEGLLLLDSGANYLNGTTDITRVFPIGKVSQEQKRDYTLVLKAHIAMISTIFPEGISMPLLDSITRAPLWKHHLDYAHGTGHGVGYFLNVHEGPQTLSYSTPPLQKHKVYEGMVTSIEPGLYREGQWGIRLENLALTQPDGESKEFGKFLKFETLSLYPFERECIDSKLLSGEEIGWINTYHNKVYTRLCGYLNGEMRTWLDKKCKNL